MTQPLTQQHIPKDLNPQWHRCENLVFWYDCQRKENFMGFDDVLQLELLGFWAFFFICCSIQIPALVDVDLSSV